MANGSGFEIPAGTIIMETAVSYKGVDRDLKELEKRGEEAGKSVSESVGRGARGAARSTEDLRRGLRASREELQEGERELSLWADTADEAAQTGAGLALVFGRRLVGGLRGALGWIGKTSAGLLSLTSVGLEQAGQGLRDLGQELRESETRWRAFGGAAEAAGTTLQWVAGVAAKASSAIIGAQIAAGAAAAAFVLASKHAADEFVPSFNRVLTLIPDGVEGLDELRREVSHLAGDLGVTAEVANRTFYQVLSALPHLVEEPERALHVLRAALQVAATGFAEGETAARAITAIMNAFSLEAEQATEVADKLFAAQNQGVTTFGEMASEIGKVSNLTSSMNADFEDLLGILATVTPSGENTSRVMTQIRSVLAGMLQPTEELNAALGGSATGFVRDQGLLAALQRIVEVTGGNPQMISEMFGRREAVALIVALSQSMDELETKTRGVAEAGGETEATFAQMMDSLEGQKSLLKGEFADALRQWGFQWERLGTVALKSLKPITDQLGEAVRLTQLAAAGDLLGPFARLLSGNIAGPVGPTLELGEQLRQRLGLGGDDQRVEPVELPQGPQPPEGFTPPSEIREAVEKARELVNQFRQSTRFAVEMSELDLIQLEEVDRARSLREHMEAMRDALGEVVGPEADGFQRGPGGMLTAEGDTERRMLQLARFTEELNRQNLTAEQRLEAVQEKMDELGLSVEDVKGSTSELARVVLRELLQALPQWAAEMLGIADANRETEESTSDLLTTVRDLAQLAGGVVSLAGAFGLFGDEAEAALNRAVTSTTQLVQGIDSLKNLAEDAGFLAHLGPIGAIAGGAAGFISAIGGLLGESAEERRHRERLEEEARALADALERLRQSADAMRSVFDQVPADVLTSFQQIFSEIEFGLADALGGITGGGLPAVDDLRRMMDEMGLTMEDLRNLADAAGVEINDLEKALDGQAVSTRAVKDEVEALREGLNALDLERALSTFEGQMGLLRDEFELLDIESPVDQLERLREVLLGLETDLPPALEQALAGADLSTAEGRRQMEAALEALFRQLQAGELGPEDLGGLTLQQFRDLLGQLEGTLDEAREEAGETRAFQQVNTIQEVTANRMVGTLSTISFYARRQTSLQEQMVRLLGGEPTAALASAPPPPSLGGTGGGGGDLSLTIRELNVGAPTFEGGVGSLEEARAFGRAQGHGVAQGISERLAEHRLNFEQSQGRRQVRAAEEA